MMLLLAHQPPTKEDTMDRNHHPDRGEKVRWAAGAIGIVLTYFGVFALLMYPVLEATSRAA
jgi:hypothetical protein